MLHELSAEILTIKGNYFYVEYILVVQLANDDSSNFLESFAYEWLPSEMKKEKIIMKQREREVLIDDDLPPCDVHVVREKEVFLKDFSRERLKAITYRKTSYTIPRLCI